MGGQGGGGGTTVSIFCALSSAILFSDFLGGPFVLCHPLTSSKGKETKKRSYSLADDVGGGPRFLVATSWVVWTTKE